MFIEEKKMGRAYRSGLLASVIATFILIVVSGCFIPGLLGESDDPPGQADPTGVDNTLYGKFYVYQVGGGDIADLGGAKVDYILGEEYLPPNEWEDAFYDYNYLHQGSGVYSQPWLTLYGTTIEDFYFYYKDQTENQRNASKMPEGAILNNELALYYTDHAYLSFGSTNESGCGSALEFPETIPPPPSEAYKLTGNVFYRGVFNNAGGVGDRDVFAVDIEGPGRVMIFRTRYRSYMAATATSVYTPPSVNTSILHKARLSLYDSSGNPLRYPETNALVQSTTANDGYDWLEADLTYRFPSTLPGNTVRYYLLVEDLLSTDCAQIAAGFPGGGDDYIEYQLRVEEPGKDLNLSHIRKGEIQPARSGNPNLNGGPYFEPDDFLTKTEDYWPDCDGIPGTGDEGDAGIDENCDDYSQLGSGDGAMQYQEVDDKSAIDDGEYFIGKNTNVGAGADSEASIIHTPDRNTLLMFVNYGSRIYMLESLDGKIGLQWDLGNIVNDRPAVVPRMEGRRPGSTDAPVVSSGTFGFCDTVPDANDQWATPEFAEAQSYAGTTPITGALLSGSYVNSPQGYPNTYGITYGSNHHLDSKPLVDELAGNAITSGPDGIINTFYAPQYFADWYRPERVSKSEDPVFNPGLQDTPQYTPFYFNFRNMSGPANPDNPTIYSRAAGAYDQILAPFGGTNLSGFLLGDDEWNTAVFAGGVLNPPEYWQKQKCGFFNQAEQFDRCAYGVPVDENGEEPASILSGWDNELNTVEVLFNNYRGDDHLCNKVDGATVTVAVCTGPDGKFGYEDLYIALEGDDQLEFVYDPPHTAASYRAANPTDPNGASLGIRAITDLWSLVPGATAMGDTIKIGVGPGPDGVLQTFLLDSYTIYDYIDWTVTIGGDHYCETMDGRTAICPGLEAKFDLYDLQAPTQIESKKLMTLWSMYLNSPTKKDPEGYDSSFEPWVDNQTIAKRDHYSLYDDYFCEVNGSIAICPGENEYFQGYPMRKRLVVAGDEDLISLYKDNAHLLGEDCYWMVSEVVQDHPTDEEETVYRIYREFGVRHDDVIRWDQNRGYYITTGKNGINQSCFSGGDILQIGFNEGLKDQTIITAGVDGALTTRALADELIDWALAVQKIGTGSDGIMNSYALGDDRVEIFMGTGKPDMPCILSGDGKADTEALDVRMDPTLPTKLNDTQLFMPGEVTGFDAYQVWGADALRVDNRIYLYYTALGWDTLPESFRDSRGALGDKGECKRAGLDRMWGLSKNEPKLDDKANTWGAGDARSFLNEDFYYAIDNNNGVALAPRIGVAVSNIQRLRVNPTDWDYFDDPAIDLGQQCSGTLDFPIDLPLELPGLVPDINWDGAYSPDAVVTESITDEGVLFALFYTGLYATENPNNELAIASSQVGLARSMDGIHFEQVRDVAPILSTSDFNLDAVLGSATNYDFPTVVGAGFDDYGEPMYGMFFNQYETVIPLQQSATSVQNRDLRKKDHIGYALRKGKIQLSCDLSSGFMTPDREKAMSMIQFAVLFIPVAFIFGLRLIGRKKR